MQAITYSRYGPPGVLTFSDIPIPSFRSDEILVEVHAAGVNPVDWKVRQGDLKVITGKKFPKQIGSVFAGYVEQVGQNVTNYQVGDPVFGFVDARSGRSYADYIAVKSHNIAPLPHYLSFVEGAGVGLAASTALQALRTQANIRPGQKVLLNGCSGGVGTFAIQIAKAFDTHVTGICSTRNVLLSKDLGADEVVDYTRKKVRKILHKYDIIFDIVGTIPLLLARRLLTNGGTYISTIPHPLSMAFGYVTNIFNEKKLKTVFVKPTAEDLLTLSEFISKGTIKSVIDKKFILSETAQAHEYSQSSRARGKVILLIR